MAEGIEKHLSTLEKVVALASERARAGRKEPNMLMGELAAALESVVRKCEILAALGPAAATRALVFTEPLIKTLNASQHSAQARTLRSRLEKLHPALGKSTVQVSDAVAHGNEQNEAAFSGPRRRRPQPTVQSFRSRAYEDVTPTPARASPFKAGAWVVHERTGQIGLVDARIGKTRGLLGEEWQLMVDLDGHGQNVCWVESELRLATEEDRQRLRDRDQRRAKEFADGEARLRKVEAELIAKEMARAEEKQRREAVGAKRTEARLAKMRKARDGCELLAIARRDVTNGEVLLGRASVDENDPAYVVFRRMPSGNLKIDRVYRSKAGATRFWNQAFTSKHVALEPQAKEFDYLCAEVAGAVRRCLAEEN